MREFDFAILGGGQLALMLTQAALKLGLSTVIYAEQKDSPAFRVASGAIVAPYDNKQKLAELARIAPAAVIDWENIPAATLAFLATIGVEVAPLPALLQTAQDRLLEAQFAKGLGVPVVPFAHVSNDLTCAARTPGSTVRARLEPLLPGVLKTRHGGYDGKGQMLVKSWHELLDAHEALSCAKCILQKWVDIEREISVIVARGKDGKYETYPAVDNVHQNGILVRTLYRPGLIPVQHEQEAQEYVVRLITAAKAWGLLAGEFFITKDGRLLFNEMAPRPHNSGHWTIEGCRTSQFEQLVRAAVGLPLAPIEPVQTTVMMKNLIGSQVGKAEDYRKRGFEVHIYGKELRPGRKMGHATRVHHL
jgi:5-(carboxyamino)imidazole ribonucleotide synthase